MPNPKPCKREDCDVIGPVIKGYCPPHYRSWYYKEGWREAKPHPSRNATIEERLKAHYKVNPENGCWEKTGWGTKAYGRISINSVDEYMHIVSYKLYKGEIPEGFDVDHLCHNMTCCNPEHLDAVPRRVNLMRGNNSIIARNTKISHPECICDDIKTTVCPFHGNIRSVAS